MELIHPRGLTVNPNELLAERAGLIKQARDILDKAAKEKRADLTAEETAQFDTLHAEAEKRKVSAERILRQADAERALGEGAGRSIPPVDEKRGSAPADRRDSQEYRSAFSAYVRGGFNAMGLTELRALQADLDVSGGYMVAPTQLVAMLVKAIDNQVFMRGIANVLPPVVGSDSIGAPALDADPDDADWTAEIDTVSGDSTMSFGKRELKPHLSSKLVKVSNKLLARSVIPADQLVIDRLAYKFGVTEEKAFLTGSGSGKPLGVFTASNDGIPTSRDTAGSNTTTAILPDSIFDVKYSLKPGYLASPSCRWVFHRDFVKMLSKLKDDNDQYLWLPGLNGSSQDTLAGIPLITSEYAPSTVAASAYCGILGDFRYYWIADAAGFAVQRLNELYAVNNQAGFIGRRETDGMPVLGEAFARMKFAAA